MKMNSISGVTCYVKDVKKTADFYETLGFRIGKQGPDHVTCYVNWFWVDCIAIDAADGERKQEAQAPNKGSGVYLYIKVDNIDEFYEDVVTHAMKPLSEPEKRPSGNREFVLRDPDGYKLVFFEKK
ncbi:MAG: VOC family protein [Patescibacteria group bacterium]